MADLLAGQVVLMFDQPVSPCRWCRRKLRVLGITSERFPTLRTSDRGGGACQVRGYIVVGICAPGATPDRSWTGYGRRSKVPGSEIRDRLLRDGIEPVGSTPEEFLAFYEA
jgi:hypothetical protein